MCADSFGEKNKVIYKDYRRLFKSMNKMRLMTSGHLRSYIDNTELYLKYVWENSQ